MGFAAILVLQLVATAQQAGAPSIGPGSLVNAATGQLVLAPYSIATLYGTDLFLDGAANSIAGTEIPEAFGGVTVLIGMVPAGIFYVSANQINLLIPNSLGAGTYSIAVLRNGVASQYQSITLTEFAPGLFGATHAGGSPVTPDNPAVPGEVVVFYATGLGPARPNPPGLSTAPSTAPIVAAASFQVLLDGVAMDPSLIQYAGLAPGNAGLYQVNIRMPGDLPSTNPEVRLEVAGSRSPPGQTLATAPANSCLRARPE